MEIYPVCVCERDVSCTYLFSVRGRNRRRKTGERERYVYGGLVPNDFWFLPHDLASFLSFLLYSSQSLISDLCFQMASLNAPFSPLLNRLPLKYLYSLLQGQETEGMKKEGRDWDLSIKDEQHLKCIKRGDEHTCSGMARCNPWLNA